MMAYKWPDRQKIAPLAGLGGSRAPDWSDAGPVSHAHAQLTAAM